MFIRISRAHRHRGISHSVSAMFSFPERIASIFVDSSDVEWLDLSAHGDHFPSCHGSSTVAPGAGRPVAKSGSDLYAGGDHRIHHAAQDPKEPCALYEITQKRLA